LFIAASVALVPHIPTEFQPLPDPDYYALEVTADPGAGLAGLERLAREAGGIAAERPETKHVFIELGATPGQGGIAGISLGTALPDLRSAMVNVSVKPGSALQLAEIRQALRPALGGLRGGKVYTAAPSGTADLQLLLTGENPALLAATRAALAREMASIRGLRDVRPAIPNVAPAIPKTMAPRPIAPNEAETAIRLGTIGEEVGEALSAEGESLPLHLRIAGDSGDARLPDVPVRMADSTLASLAMVGPPRAALGASILRHNGDRVDGLEANFALSMTSGEAAEAIARLPVLRRLPPGVRIVQTGDQEELATLFRSMTIALLGAAAAIYLTLALLFRSAWLPAIVLSSLPLAIGGAIVGLVVSRSALNLPALIGFLLLLGLAAKNSILLVEHAARLQRTNLSLRVSLLAAGERRVRAIIMTSVAMAAGMLPAALTAGAGDEFRQPMAFAVIGGLVSSTALSLLFVPAVYEALLSRVARKKSSV
jgi:HAE1 family hydrophobic/amphiphilic exporter-1